MQIIKFRRLNRPAQYTSDGVKIETWEIAFSEEYLNAKLNGETAEVIMPAKPWVVRFWRKFFPLKEIKGREGEVNILTNL